MRPFHVLVCGGRHYTDRAAVFKALDALAADKGPLYVIEGGNPQGADRFARQWRAAKLHPGQTYRAEWDRLGKAAGPTRNKRMLVDGQPDLVAAFPGGTGTADMVRQAEAFGCPVVHMGAPIPTDHEGLSSGPDEPEQPQADGPPRDSPATGGTDGH